jgi:hypothetical protein
MLNYPSQESHAHASSFLHPGAGQSDFRRPAKAADWLDRPCVQLGGHTPRHMLGGEDGVRRVEELLLQLDDDQRLGPG